MASSGFEGFEKRLELVFSLPEDDNGSSAHGLRLLSIDVLQETLDAAQCAVVSAVGTARCDAYVLSESSLFVYPSRLILKTCGTTRLLTALPVLLRRAAELAGLRLRSCRYSRGAYLFPDAQPFPHAYFADEVRFLDETVRSRRAAVLPGHGSHTWHVYVASTLESDCHVRSEEKARFTTVEVCMTGLDPTLARRFHLAPGDAGRTSHVVGDEMTSLSGLAGVMSPTRSSFTCGYAFAPCGYSMNALGGGARYATVHVTPEDGHSYASYERGGGEAIASVRRAVAVFRPATVSVQRRPFGFFHDQYMLG